MNFCRYRELSYNSPALFLFTVMTVHNEDLNDLYSSPNIVRVIKSSIMRACNAYGGLERRVQGLGGDI
jgi:hypothetical protein